MSETTGEHTPTTPRLLPWELDGKPQYLVGGEDSPLARIADQVEDDQLAEAEHTLTQSGRPEMLTSSADELLQICWVLRDSLQNVLRIAESRGGRS
jgi:hypothetical protein